MFENQPLNSTKVEWTHSAVSREAHVVQPEFAFAIRRANVDMRRLETLVRVEVEAERADPEDGWHGVQ